MSDSQRAYAVLNPVAKELGVDQEFYEGMSIQEWEFGLGEIVGKLGLAFLEHSDETTSH